MVEVAGHLVAARKQREKREKAGDKTDRPFKGMAPVATSSNQAVPPGFLHLLIEK
jgi:hypothetical protein